MRKVDYLIVGGGLTGLGAAYKLKKYGISSFVVLESGAEVGGIAASSKDKAGFTWDMGGHVLFSRDDRFIRCVGDAMKDDLLTHQRKAKVHVAGHWTGYPFQDHVHQLSPELEKFCRKGLTNAVGPGEQTRSFKDWIEQSFGEGICQLFLEPYNRKVWTVQPERMGFQWVGERVSTAQKKHREASGKRRAYLKWGPNSEFRYPSFGGIGAIAHRMAKETSDHVKLRNEVVGIDPLKKIASVKRGESYRYKYLLSTVPLDRLIKNLIRPEQNDLKIASGHLEHNRVSVVGIGLDTDGDLETSWMYFPEKEVPFYRLTNLHNYSPNTTPKGKHQAALMAEVSCSQKVTQDDSALISKVFDGLVATGIVKRSDEKKVVSTWSKEISYAYPIPTLERDQALEVIHPYLENHCIYSRGRFGGWKYEVGNMDHSFMQGFEWAERMVEGREESIYSV